MNTEFNNVTEDVSAKEFNLDEYLAEQKKNRAVKAKVEKTLRAKYRALNLLSRSITELKGRLNDAEIDASFALSHLDYQYQQAYMSYINEKAELEKVHGHLSDYYRK